MTDELKICAREGCSRQLPTFKNQSYCCLEHMRDQRQARARASYRAQTPEQRQRISERRQKRYLTDPEYRERIKATDRARRARERQQQ